MEYKKLLIGYVPGMDLRRINQNHTPYISGLFSSFPWEKIKTFPCTELVPTLLTGVYPHEHGIWQVRLRPGRNSLKPRLIDRMPDFLTSTLQCLAHVITHSFDLAAVPSRRRRLFELKRFKYTRREAYGEDLTRIGGVESIFGVIGMGSGKSRYVFSREFRHLDRLLSGIGSGEYLLEFLELYSLDMLQHWNLGDTEKIGRFYRGVDDFIKNLHAKCRRNDITLVLLSDHGQEEIKWSLDLKGELKRSGLSEKEYSYFMEISTARFWFHTEKARQKIGDLLSSIGHGTVLSYKQMHQYNVRFEDDQYGEVYFILDPGYIFFPHDFYHPLAGLILGLTDWKQRNRMFSPNKHRGNHGYLPHHESEIGFMMILDPGWQVENAEVDIIDVAPSILGMLGCKKPDSMKGKTVFKIRTPEANS